MWVLQLLRPDPTAQFLVVAHTAAILQKVALHFIPRGAPVLGHPGHPHHIPAYFLWSAQTGVSTLDAVWEALTVTAASCGAF